MRDEMTILCKALNLTPDESGGWSGPPITHHTPGAPFEARTRLLPPAAALRWRHTTADTLLFFHSGGPLSVHLHDSSGGTPTAMLGDDPAAGALPQYALPAGVSHTLLPASGQYTLFSEAVVPGRSDWTHEQELRVAHMRPLPPSPSLRTPRKQRSPVESLFLEPHIEGGYYRQTYESDGTMETPRGKRFLANSIFYFLDTQSPVGHLHRNQSDITHFTHGPGPIRYLMVDPDGVLHERILGTDTGNGEVPVLTCPGGWWKSSSLPEGVTQGLVSEVVAPGFDFADQELLTGQELVTSFPHLADRLRPYASSGAG
ncbi:MULTISPECIES: cupin domain-containing protein [Streptomyces]|uniref:Cupin domain-containing protein n=2 Tax=Streptomyces TaxID=1883 RepID=A0ABV9IV50_9ACTN